MIETTGMIAMKRCVLAALGFAAACSPEQSVRDLCDEGLCAPGTLTWAVRAESVGDSTADAVAITPDEPPWFAGAYGQTLEVAERDTEHFGGWDSVGEHDAYLARTGVRRLDTQGAFMNAAYFLRVVGIVPDFEDGAILFAIGQQEDLRERFEASWIDRTGAATRRTIALLDDPGGFGGAKVTADDRGWPIVAVSGTRVDLDGVIHDGARSMIFRLGQGLARQPLADLTGVDISDLDVDGDVVALSGTYTGAPMPPEGSAPWPACADAMPCGFIAAFELGTGRFLWVQPVRSMDGALVHAVGLGGGQVVAMASVVGFPSEPNLGVGDVPLYLITLDAAGNAGAPAVVDQTIVAGNGVVIAGRDLAVTPAGAVVVAFSFRGAVMLDVEREFQDPDDYMGVVAELGTDLLWKWSYEIRAQGDIGVGTVDLSTIAVRGDQVAVGGAYLGAIQLGVSVDVAQLTPAGRPNGVAIEFHR
ncbi:MAG TPA: hypothetical protein VM261_02505 [Kofleriaceae bacterium]|nr:hypothetical protein [Kofleriaceae bacterium]